MSQDAAIQVHTTETSPVLRTLEVEVDVARVRKAFDRAYRDLGRRVRVKGFRPGKAPRSVLERLYGKVIGEDIERLLVAETLADAVEQTGLEPVAEPSVDATPPELDAPFRYTATLEVKPEISLPDLAGLQASRPPVEVTEAELLTELDGLRERNASLVEEPEDVCVARGHVVTVDFEGRVDDEPFEGGAGKDVQVEIGAERFVPGFEEGLEGARAGEERDVRVTFPDDYGQSTLAGKEAVFHVRVSAIQRRELPDLDDDFAKDLSDEFGSLEDLKARIRQDLTRQRERAARSELRRTVLDSLLERVEVETPPALVERRLMNRLQLAHQQLQGNVPHEALHRQLEAWQQEWRPQAERDVKESLLLEAVARAQGLEVGDEEIDSRIDEMAAEEGVEPARMRSLYKEEGMREGLAAHLRDEKALDALLAQAKVQEKSDT